MMNSFERSALAGVEALINKALSYDPATLARIGQLSDKVLHIECTFPPLNFDILHSGEGLMLVGNDHTDRAPDTTLKGNAASLAALALARDRSSFAGSGVEITGDQELLGEMQAILKDLDVDWETALAQLIGDVPAYIIGNTLRASHDLGNKAREQVASTVTDFAKNEGQMLPTSQEVNSFSADVRALRSDTDRLQARVDAFTAQLANNHGET